MVLVDYSDTESDSFPNDDPKSQCCRAVEQESCAASSSNNPRKRKAESIIETVDVRSDRVRQAASPPALPSSFYTLYSTNVRRSINDDPSLHGGRKRQVAHVQGNWPSHVYLEWLPNKPDLQRLEDVIANVKSVHGLELNTLLRSPIAVQLPLHVSLSAPLVLNTSSKDEFHHRITRAVSAAKVGMITTLKLGSMDLVPNFEQSRWFLVLRLVEGQGESLKQSDGQEAEERQLESLLRTCNRVCAGFGLPMLYVKGDGIGVEVGAHQEENGPRALQGREDIKEDVKEDVKKDVKDVADDVKGVGKGGESTSPFHFSIAWTLREASPEARAAIRQTDTSALSAAVDIAFDRVKVKIGNVVSDILL